MKKRRELDALVNGKAGRRKQKKGQHELLIRNSSESSEIEEFAIPQKTVVRKHGPTRFCATCMTICGFFLLTACMVALAGLVWVHIELKQEVDNLRAKVDSVKSGSEGTPAEIQEIQSKQSDLQKKLESILSGESSINKLQATLSQQFSTLNHSVQQLQKSVASAPTLSKLPQTVETLQQSLATVGSNVDRLMKDVETIKNEQAELPALKTDIQALKESQVALSTTFDSLGNSQMGKATASPNTQLYKALEQKLNQISHDFDLLNSSIRADLSSLPSHSTIISSMEYLQNKTFSLEQKQIMLEQHMQLMDTQMSGNSGSTSNVKEAVTSVLASLQNITAIHQLQTDVTDLRTTVAKNLTFVNQQLLTHNENILLHGKILDKLQSSLQKGSQEAEIFSTQSPLDENTLIPKLPIPDSTPSPKESFQEGLKDRNTFQSHTPMPADFHSEIKKNPIITSLPKNKSPQAPTLDETLAPITKHPYPEQTSWPWRDSQTWAPTLSPSHQEETKDDQGRQIDYPNRNDSIRR